ncbi:unnamed protein product [Lota lota]
MERSTTASVSIHPSRKSKGPTSTGGPDDSPAIPVSLAANEEAVRAISPGARHPVRQDPVQEQIPALHTPEHVGHHSHAVVQLTAGKHVHLDLQLLGMGRGRSAVGPEPWVVAVPTDDPEGPSLFICSGGGTPTHVASRVIQMDPGSQQQNLLFARHSEHVGHHSHAVVQLTAGKHVHLDLQLLGMGRGRSAVGPEPWVVAVPTDDPEGPSLFICSGGGAPTHVASRSPAPALPHVFP